MEKSPCRRVVPVTSGYVLPQLSLPLLALKSKRSRLTGSKSAFVSIKSDDASVQAGFSNALEHLGPLLTRSLVQNIGGNASRSELDKLSDPLKKLVVQHPRAKQWLEAALLDPSFPSTKVTAGDKLTFVKKITK